MAVVAINGSNLGTFLSDMLLADDIQPGSAPSYQLCKEIFLYHPLGFKMAKAPIKMAQSQQRQISVANGPEDRVVKAFLAEWEAFGADVHISNIAGLARVYGIASLSLLTEGKANSTPVDYQNLYHDSIAINVLDPLNTAGSLVLSQNPDQPDFQKVEGITIMGQQVHRSRSIVLMNEEPVYIAYTTSAFGYVGRSVYQRALFPMKSFLQTMITDDLVTVKCSVLVAMLEQAGSIIDNLMMKLFGTKRAIVKEAKLNNVISIGKDEKIETLNFRNMEGPYQTSRENILKNIATAADMPAKLLENETFVEGFGEGTEDAKNIAKYIDGIRVWLQPAYTFFDKIVQHRAWNPEFFAAIQKEFPDEYSGKTYEQAFTDWVNSFQAIWPEVLNEPPSKLADVDKVKLEGVTKLLETLMPAMDPQNKATLIKWAADNFNSFEQLFPEAQLELDYDLLAEYVPPIPEAFGGGDDEEEQEEPESSEERNDSVRRMRVA